MPNRSETGIALSSLAFIRSGRRDAINSQSWVKDIAYSLNHDLLHEFFELWNALQSVQLNMQDEQEDEIIWTLEASGQYSATSAYNIQFAGQVT